METCLAPFQALLYITTVIARPGLLRMTTATRSSSRAMDSTRLCILCSALALPCSYPWGFLKTRTLFLGGSLYSVALSFTLTYFLPSHPSELAHAHSCCLRKCLCLHHIHFIAYIHLYYLTRAFTTTFDTSLHAPTSDMTTRIATYTTQKMENYFTELNGMYLTSPFDTTKCWREAKGVDAKKQLIESSGARNCVTLKLANSLSQVRRVRRV